jgi:hypothetical protein
MIGEDDGIILEEDSKDEEGYMLAGQGNFLMFHIISRAHIADIFRARVVNYHFRRSYCIHRNYVSNTGGCSNTSNMLTN